MKAVGELAGEKFEFESPDVIKERFGIPVGGVPPFGNLMNLDTYFDDEVRGREVAAFNCGLQTESVVMKSADLIDVVDPKFGKFAKVE